MTLEQKIRDRVKWLEQKSAAQREVGGPEYSSNKMLWGRTQGAIGELQRFLAELPPQIRVVLVEGESR